MEILCLSTRLWIKFPVFFMEKRKIFPASDSINNTFPQIINNRSEGILGENDCYGKTGAVFTFLSHEYILIYLIK